MPLKARIALGAIAVVVIVVAGAAALLLKTGESRPPPLTGAMGNFTPLAEPTPAPAISFLDRDGKTLGLEDFRGKIVLVNLWATWCAPCIREMPTLERLQRRLGGKDFQLIALSIDRQGWSVITPFLERLGLDRLPVYHDASGDAAQILKISGLPTTVLFGRDGRELGRLVGIAEWDDDEAITLMRYYLGRR